MAEDRLELWGHVLTMLDAGVSANVIARLVRRTTDDTHDVRELVATTLATACLESAPEDVASSREEAWLRGRDVRKLAALWMELSGRASTGRGARHDGPPDQNLEPRAIHVDQGVEGPAGAMSFCDCGCSICRRAVAFIHALISPSAEPIEVLLEQIDAAALAIYREISDKRRRAI